MRFPTAAMLMIGGCHVGSPDRQMPAPKPEATPAVIPAKTLRRRAKQAARARGERL